MSFRRRPENPPKMYRDLKKIHKLNRNAKYSSHGHGEMASKQKILSNIKLNFGFEGKKRGFEAALSKFKAHISVVKADFLCVNSVKWWQH